jgi:hypothetical protein
MLLGAGFLLVSHLAQAAPDDSGRRAIPPASQPVEAFIIDQPGSYCLGGNRHAGGTGIQIRTNDVTLDLDGFCLAGSGAPKTFGVFLNGVRNVEIRNGTIKGFGDRGICGERHQEGIRVLNVRLVENGACGLCLDASGLFMKDCYVSANRMSGICPGVFATLINNVVSSNGHSGVLAGWGSIVDGNSVYANQHTGIFANYNSRVENNMLMGNNLSGRTNEAGITVRSGTLVKSNVLRDNQLTGIRALEGDNRIEGNLITYGKPESGAAIACAAGATNEISGNCCSANSKPEPNHSSAPQVQQ